MENQMQPLDPEVLRSLSKDEIIDFVIKRIDNILERASLDNQ